MWPARPDLHHSGRLGNDHRRSLANPCDGITADGLAAIEAALANQGEFHRGTQYPGQRTASANGKTLYPRPPLHPRTDKTCADFQRPAEAQLYFIEQGGSTHDPDDLNRDADGLACDWGPP